MSRRLARAVLLAAAVVALVAGVAAPALADPAEPTHYRSVVNTLDPVPTGVTVAVVGGDAFLAVAAAPGHTIEVPGYFGEPYMRVDEAGRVWLNERSPARFINKDRYGLTGVPDSADGRAEPEWTQVGSSGRFAWHDHRVHWMSTDLPPTIAGDRAAIIFPWTVRITIDGVETEVRGELLWFPATNVAGPLLIGAIGILPFLAWRRGRVLEPATIAAGAGAVALLVAVAQYAATPGSDRGAPVDAVVPAVAVVAAVLALWLGAATLRSWAAVGSAGAALIWWARGAAPALTAPVLPSALPAALERAAVALAGWVGIALILAAVVEFVRVMRRPVPMAVDFPVLVQAGVD